MGLYSRNFTMRLPDEIRNPIKAAADRFGLKECDIARTLLAEGVRSLGKNCTVLQIRSIRNRRAI